MALRTPHNRWTLATLGVWTIFCSLHGRFLKAHTQNDQGMESPNRAFQSAVTNYESGNFAQAEQILLPLLKRSPQAFDVNELMGLVLTGERKDAEALTYLRSAARTSPGSAPALLAYAACLARLGRMGEAEAQFRQAVALEPSAYDSNHDMGEFYVQAGKLASAIPYLEKAQLAQPSSYENGYDLALADIRTRKPRQAENALQNLVRYHDTAELHNLLGEAEENSGDYLSAVQEYEKAAHMDPSEANILDWGTELLLHHTFSPAVQVFIFGTEKYPGSLKMEIGLGLAYYGLASFQNAAAALMRACDLAPRDPTPYLILGETYSNSRVPVEGVVERLERLTAMDPTNARAFYYQALALWKAPQAVPGGAVLNKVESTLQKAVVLDPTFADARLQLGKLYTGENKIPEAIAAYNEAMRIDPNLADAHYRLAQLYRQSGRIAEAQNQMRVYQILHQEQLKEKDQERSKIQRFVYTIKRQGNDEPTAVR